jgi:hypothetical protein
MLQTPGGEVESRAGNQVAVVDQAAGRERLAQRGRGRAEELVMAVTQGPDGPTDGERAARPLFQQGIDHRGDRGWCSVDDPDEVEPVRGDPQTDEIAGRHA